jgi:hypothetical protein
VWLGEQTGEGLYLQEHQYLISPMTSPLDLYRTANAHVQQYGTEDALLVAAKRCDALL